MKSFTCLFLLSVATVNAVRDDEYYAAGMGNPNVDLPMYWADAHNVLEDIDQFQYLYVQFQNCAWSQNMNVYNGEDEGGASGDETDYWYMGAQPNFAANVAYSLYGVLKDGSNSGSGCSSDTFINSFVTNQGFEVFAQAMYYAGAVSTDYSQSYSSECNNGYGVACDYNRGFVKSAFSSSTCDPSYSTGVSDSMSSMNAAFQSANCIKVYDASHASSYINSNYGGGYGGNYGANNNNDDANANNNAAAQQYNGGYGGYSVYSSNAYYQYSGTPLSLLYYSSACFVQNYWLPGGGCPDPYGRLQYYQSNFNKGVRKSMKVDPYVKYRKNMEKGKKLVKLGAMCFMAAALMYVFEQLLIARKRIHSGKIPNSITTANGEAPTEAERLKQRQRSSVVELVRSGTNKLKSSMLTAAAGAQLVVANAAASTVAAVKKSQPKNVSDDDSDEGGDFDRMQDDAAQSSKSGAYQAPSSDPVETMNISGLASPMSSGSEATDGIEQAVEVERKKAKGVRGIFGKMKKEQH